MKVYVVSCEYDDGETGFSHYIQSVEKTMEKAIKSRQEAIDEDIEDNDLGDDVIQEESAEEKNAIDVYQEMGDFFGRYKITEKDLDLFNHKK